MTEQVLVCFVFVVETSLITVLKRAMMSLLHNFIIGAVLKISTKKVIENKKCIFLIIDLLLNTG